MARQSNPATPGSFPRHTPLSPVESVASRLGPAHLLAWPSLAAVALALRRFPPEQFPFYPRCPIHAAFGILCPGCGGTRALAALFHGHIATALSSNALLTLLAPAALLLAAIDLRQRLRGSPSTLFARIPSSLWTALAAATALFGLWRNLS